MKIYKSTDTIENSALITLIYGEPGIGKTSLSYTTNKPFLFSCEGGANRAIRNGDSGMVERFEDISTFLDSGQSDNYDTFVLDPVDHILTVHGADYVGRMDKKAVRRGGQLTLQGYGALKSAFEALVNKMRSKGKNLVLIAHSKQITNNDDTIKYIPKVTGSSYDMLMEICDLVGYIKSVNNERTIDFNPSDEHIGKNTGEHKILKIPHYTDDSFQMFLQGIIDTTNNKISSLSELQKKTIEAIKVAKKEVDSMDFEELQKAGFDESISVQMSLYKDKQLGNHILDILEQKEAAEDFNNAISSVSGLKKPFIGVWREVQEMAKRKSLTYDKNTKQFSDVISK